MILLKVSGLRQRIYASLGFFSGMQDKPVWVVLNHNAVHRGKTGVDNSVDYGFPQSFVSWGVINTVQPLEFKRNWKRLRHFHIYATMELIKIGNYIAVD